MRSFAALLIALSLTVAACGGDHFVADVSRVPTDLQRALADWGQVVGRDVADGDSAAAAAKLDATSQAMTDAADEFGAIDTPDELEHARGQFIDALDKMAGSLHTAARAARAGDLKRV